MATPGPALSVICIWWRDWVEGGMNVVLNWLEEWKRLAPACRNP
jgi:hypothetical protein